MLNIPKYKVRPSPERFLANKLLILIVLGVLLYVGVYVNYYLLSESIPGFLNLIFVVGIIILLVIDSLLCYMQYGRYEYVLYDDRLELNYGKIKKIQYSSISRISYSQGFLDRMLKTGSIVIRLNDSRKIQMRYLHNSNQTYFWLQKHLRNAE